VLKFPVEFFDVVFPLDLGPLTYRAPGSLKKAVLPGMLVRAEIRKSLKNGIVLGPAVTPPEGGIKEVEGVLGDGPVLNPAMLSLVKWMSEYYFRKEGLVLKGMLPREFFEGVKPRRARKAPSSLHAVMPPGALPVGDEAAASAIKTIRDNARKKYYKTFLLHAPSTRYELSFVLEAIGELKNVIVLCPEHAEVKQIEGALREAAGDRLVVLHSGLARGRRAEAVERISTGLSDIVLGSRSAVFAPLREVSMIAVLREEDASYKEEGGIRYNARDIAVMRGYLEGATVLLSSICPSVESFHNAKEGKYTLLEAPASGRPRVRIIDMRGVKTLVSRKLLGASRARMEKGERVMFLINKKGYSMLQCGDCGSLVTCSRCGIPMVFYKGEGTLRCRYCGQKAPPPETCLACGGLIGPVGVGVERLEEELRAFSPIGVQSKSALKVLMETEAKLAVGTKLLSRRPELREGFSLAGVMNADAHLYIPDFRSTERAFQDLLYTAERVRPDGDIFIQTRSPGAGLFRYMRRYDFKGFYRDVLREREALMYPPFSRMALFTTEGDQPPVLPRLNGVEVLGPIASLTKRGKRVWKILLKAPSRKALRQGVRQVLKGLRGGKATVDVDPISI
jgi:primosomal protein N' (replication factor Y)